jgi:hypothetical protein
MNHVPINRSHIFYNEDKTVFDSVSSVKELLPDVKSSLQTIEISKCIRKKQKEYHTSS